jgi:hypothetical protein
VEDIGALASGSSSGSSSKKADSSFKDGSSPNSSLEQSFSIPNMFFQKSSKKKKSKMYMPKRPQHVSVVATPGTKLPKAQKRLFEQGSSNEEDEEDNTDMNSNYEASEPQVGPKT